MNDEHGHANCDDARHTLYSFLDGEINETTRVQIQQHLEACGPCFEAFDFEAELLQVIGRKCGEQAPDGLTAKILSALQGDGLPPLTS